MSLTVNLYYTGKNGSARKFAEEMESSGVADRIRKEPGNEKYEYFIPLDIFLTRMVFQAVIKNLFENNRFLTIFKD